METIDAVKNAGRMIQSRFKAEGEIDQNSKDAVASMRALSDALSMRLEEKEKLIEGAGESRAELLKQLGEISTECQGVALHQGDCGEC